MKRIAVLGGFATVLAIAVCVASWPLMVRSQTVVSPVASAVQTHAHHLLIHVASGDPAAMAHAISAADNAMKFYAARGEPIAIEIVANGAGVRMMRVDASPVAPSIAYLHKTYPALVLTACGTALQSMETHEGHALPLLDGVRVVPAGIARIIELEELGWSYVRS